MRPPLPTWEKGRPVHLEAPPTPSCYLCPDLSGLHVLPVLCHIHTQPRPSPAHSSLPFHEEPQPQLSPLRCPVLGSKHRKPPSTKCPSLHKHTDPHCPLGQEALVGPDWPQAAGPHLSMAAQIFRPSSR